MFDWTNRQKYTHATHLMSDDAQKIILCSNPFPAQLLLITEYILFNFLYYQEVSLLKQSR